MNFKTVKMIYILFASLFIGSLPWWPYPLTYLVKALPIITMGVFILGRPNRGLDLKILGVGFLFAATGDIFLDLDREAYFVHGLASFLVGHLCYAISYFLGRDLSRVRWPFILGSTLMTALMLYFLIPKLGNLLFPVLCYISVINIMVVMASLHGSKGIGLAVGALVFMISDSLIAINKFLLPFKVAPVLIMITYYLGQYLMAKAMLENEKTSN